MIEKKIEKQKTTETTGFPFGAPAIPGPRIVFMGTPEFAVSALKKIWEAGFNIVGVITAPDKAAGRGLELQQSAVKKFAVEHKLPILQPEKLKNPEFLEQLKALRADLQVVVAFRMLPELVWNMPALGTINLHGSLLPQYRGAAPINWAIINGEKQTGVTSFKLKHEIDTGDILLKKTIAIGEDETAGELHDRMKEAGAELLVETIRCLSENKLKALPQTSPAKNSDEPLKHAPKIFTDTCRIDWNKSTNEIYNLIRGLSPYPAAFTSLDGKTLKVFKAIKEMNTSSKGAGNIETDKKTFLKFSCADGFISILELQLEGKKKMPVQDFLRGYHFP